MAITIRDVAARAGVTPTVVSRVLHNRASTVRVSEATAERVREAAVELGYRVNVMARNFRERQTLMIGVLHGIGFARPNLGADSRYFALLMDGIVEGAFAAGYSVTLCPKLLGDRPEDALADGRFDGFVWYSTLRNEENFRMLERCTAPLVLIHTPSHRFANRFPSVTCDNAGGISQGIEHLVRLGHRKIAFAWESDLDNTEAAVRRESFVRRMAELGLPVSEADILDARLDRSGVREYFEKGVRHTAIMGTTDEVAASFLLLAPEYGLSVPNDLSLVGFDSTLFCEGLRPTLTSISQPLTDIGRIAVEQLVRAMQGHALEAMETVLPCGFDVRESIGPPPRR